MKNIQHMIKQIKEINWRKGGVIALLLLVYLLVEYIIVPQAIEIFLQGKMLNRYMHNITTTDEKKELLEFVNKNNYGEFIVSDITRAENGIFVFTMSMNEAYKDGSVKIPKEVEGFTSYMQDKFKNLIVFDIVTIFMLCLKLAKNRAKKKGNSYMLLVLVMGGMPFCAAGITWALLVIFAVKWSFGNVFLWLLKYGCILCCMLEVGKVFESPMTVNSIVDKKKEESFLVTVQRK